MSLFLKNSIQLKIIYYTEDKIEIINDHYLTFLRTYIIQ